MASKGYQDIQGYLQTALKSKVTKLEQRLNDELGVQLEEMREEIEDNLNRIIIEKFYKVRQAKPSYQRTYQFAEKAGKVVIKQGGGYYTLTMFLDTTHLDPKAPPKKGMLGSYCILGRGGTITPLDEESKSIMVDTWDEQYGITEAFNEWFQREMQPKLAGLIRGQVMTHGFEDF